MLESWETILKEYEGMSELMEFYPASDEGGFSVGTVRKVFEEVDDDEEDFYEDPSVIIAALGPDGEADGLMWFPIYNLSKVCVQTQYLKKREAMFDAGGMMELPDNEERGLDRLLNLSMNGRKVISLDTGEDEPFVYGIVMGYSDAFVQMHCYTTNGDDDGISFIDKDRIEFCQYQGEDELAVERLLKG